MRFKKERCNTFKSILLTLMVLIFLCVIFASGYAFYVVASSPGINPQNIYDELSKNSYIFDKDGNLISELDCGEDREMVTIGEVPDNLKNAFIAIEDKTFYSHHGFNFRRIAGAILEMLMGKSDSISGTSTITQQLARNIYLPEIKSERSIRRKITEAWYAHQIERELSKDEILEAYLNAIYLGYGAYGVGSASDMYFSKKVEDLTLAECAALAALPQMPDTYALITDEDTGIEVDGVYVNDKSKERRFLDLDLMVEEGYVTREEADDAKVEIEEILNPHFGITEDKYTYFKDHVIDTVISDLTEEKGMSEEKARRLVYSGGLEIYTTLDSTAQEIIYNEFQNDYNFPWSEEEPQAAMVITEVGTGRVIAMVGGRKASGERLLNRAMTPRQPGSSIKPLSVYAAALQKSFECEQAGYTFPFVDYGIDKQGVSGWGNYITAASQVKDEKLYFNGEIWPYNFSRTFSGKQTFRSAIYQSLNTCAVKIQMQVGADYSIGILKKLGITTVVENEDTSDENSAALALGAMTNGVTPLEMSLAYAVFPNNGIYNSEVCYTKVTDANGKTLLERHSKERKVLDEGVAWIMTDILQGVVSRGIAGDARISGVSVGGKTGTTNDTYDIWFDGFTPKYSAALWIGTDHNTPMDTLSSRAALLWSNIMSQIADITEGEYPMRPSNVIYYGGEYYTEGTQGGITPYSSNSSQRANSSSNSGDVDDLFEPIP